MSYHILHIADFGCSLVKERGLLVCRKDSRVVGKIALEDLRAVVLFNGAVSISGSVLAELASFDAVVVHCKNYKPVGITVPNIRTNDAKVVLNQSAANVNINGAVWKRLLYYKIKNNVSCLKRIGINNSKMEAMFTGGRCGLDEGRFAREYWKVYFPALGEFGMRRNPDDASSRVNSFLNYGYGILGALIHRGLIVAGLNYLLGVNHKTYYKNTPLVFDVIEPFRAFADFALFGYMNAAIAPNIKSWAVYFGKFLRDFRVKKGVNSVKLMDSVDCVCESLANVYRRKKAAELWLPTLE